MSQSRTVLHLEADIVQTSQADAYCCLSVLFICPSFPLPSLPHLKQQHRHVCNGSSAACSFLLSRRVVTSSGPGSQYIRSNVFPKFPNELAFPFLVSGDLFLAGRGLPKQLRFWNTLYLLCIATRIPRSGTAKVRLVDLASSRPMPGPHANKRELGQNGNAKSPKKTYTYAHTLCSSPSPS